MSLHVDALLLVFDEMIKMASASTTNLELAEKST
jgi:hypothetical protein